MQRENDRLFTELWTSLASLLRSYTALHGLSANRMAQIEATDERIEASHGDRWLRLTRTGAQILWEQSRGDRGELELTPAGTLRGPVVEEEMDMAAESWARDLMRELQG
jgi:hypothetical protein